MNDVSAKEYYSLYNKIMTAERREVSKIVCAMLAGEATDMVNNQWWKDPQKLVETAREISAEILRQMPNEYAKESI